MNIIKEVKIIFFKIRDFLYMNFENYYLKLWICKIIFLYLIKVFIIIIIIGRIRFIEKINKFFLYFNFWNRFYIEWYFIKYGGGEEVDGINFIIFLFLFK